ncbi:hypothetical protein Bca101_044055 [Brassica carinata]
MAMAVFKSPIKGEFHGPRKVEGKEYKHHHLLQRHSSGRRCVFLQTETGCVLGMDLDRSDSVNTVKNRLQIAFNFPMEESSLTFVDMVLKNDDLSAVRNDSPLQLKRNLMHRSSSTMFLSPTGNDLKRKDLSGPIEILSYSRCFLPLKQTANDIVEAMKTGV